jgi:hypothetical protein
LERSQDGRGPEFKNTNVFRFVQAYSKHSGTNDFYVAGVGTRFDRIGGALGGVFGLGEVARIKEAYDGLCLNWVTRHDTVIDVVGFSRGAAPTLEFFHPVSKRGIRRPGGDEVIEANPLIRFLGVWDTVGGFGLANLGNTELNLGHHLELPRKNLRYCFHALAIDERRPSFLPTRLPGAYECWFRGVHSDIGGGNGNRGLNDIAMHWMMSKAKAAQLPITDEDIAALKPDPAAKPKLAKDLPLNIRLVGALDRRHNTINPVGGFFMPPATCPIETAIDETQAKELGNAGITLLPMSERIKVLKLWETAGDEAQKHGFTLDHIREPLLALLQARIPLVTDDAKLTTAGGAVRRLIATASVGAKDHGFPVLNEFFFSEALFKSPRLFPLTD